MKKRILALMLLGCLAFTACGKKEETESVQADTAESEDTVEAEVDKDEIPTVDSTVEELGIDAFMTLGEYKGIALEKTVYTVSDADVEEQITADLRSYPVEMDDPEATVAMYDTINLDYSGSVDGEVFERGTAENQELKIGSGQFIDGFEDQMIGMKIGESGEVNVTFPDDYWNAEMAGKEAVFAVTVNDILTRPLDEPTDEWVQENTDYTTVDEYRAGVKVELEEQNEQTVRSEMMDDAWVAVSTSASFIQYPQDQLDECYEQQKLSYENYALSYGMTYDELVEATGITEDDLLEAAKYSLQNVMIMEYICMKEDITEDSEFYQEHMATVLEENGFESKEAAVEMGVSEWALDFVIKYDCVMNFILDHAVITEAAAE